MDRPADALERERLLAELVRREEGRPGQPPPAIDESTLAAMQADLETLIADLRRSPPLDAFEDESGCRRAIELAEQACRTGTSGRSSAAAAGVAGPLPKRIGPYQVVAQLGRGGMGAVYRAKHDKLKRVVAVKVLSAARINDPAAQARFEREMEAIGALNHPHIVAAHDAGEADGMHYLVMECVEGLDLAALVRRTGALPIAEACEIIRQAALGLKAASDRGIVHRDVKPSNLMLAEGTGEHSQPTVKVLDFGLARLAPVQSALSDLTFSGQIMGTLKYMAPEQVASSRDTDLRTDVYSLGATLYKLLSGTSPFSHEALDSPLALLAALGNQDPLPLTSQRPELPAKLVAVVQRMMAKRPENRFSSFAEVIDALAPWARGAKLADLLQRARGLADPGQGRPPASLNQAGPPVAALERSLTSRRGWPRGWPQNFLWGAITGVVVSLILATPTTYRWFVKTPVTERGAVTNRDPFQHARHAAQWVQSRGGAIEIAYDDTGSRALAATDPLPKQNFHLNSASLAGDAAVTGQDLAKFDNLPFFFSLMLNQTPADDAALRELGRLPLLKCLYLSETKITDAALADLNRYPGLTHLHLERTAITNAGLTHLAELQNLNQLYLVGCLVTDRGLSHLTGLNKLGTLWLENTEVTAAGVAKLKLALPDCFISSDFSQREIAAAIEAQRSGESSSAQGEQRAAAEHDRDVAQWLVPRAAEIEVATAGRGAVTLKPDEPLPDDFNQLLTTNLDGNQSLTNDDLARFDKLPLFTVLSLGQTNIDDSGLRRLGELPRLQMLFLSDTAVGDAGLEQLRRYPRLEVLHLTDTQVTDAGLAHLAGHRMLYDLSLIRCKITDAGLDCLSALKQLRILAVHRTGVTARGIAELQQSLPECEIRSDFSPEDLAEARESLPNDAAPSADH